MIDFTGTNVVAIFAHPDDEAFTIGGVLSAFADRGASVTLITATRGEQGEIAHPSLATPDILGEVREQELLEAAAILGISSVRFLDFRDSGMYGTESNQDPAAFIQQSTEAVARKLATMLEEIRPDLVITFSEEGAYLHPDHIHIHESVVAISQIAPDLIPHLYFSSFPREFFFELANQDHGAFAGMSEERRNRMGQPLSAFTAVINVEPFVDRKISALPRTRPSNPRKASATSSKARKRVADSRRTSTTSTPPRIRPRPIPSPCSLPISPAQPSRNAEGVR